MLTARSPQLVRRPILFALPPGSSLHDHPPTAEEASKGRHGTRSTLVPLL